MADACATCGRERGEAPGMCRHERDYYCAQFGAIHHRMRAEAAESALAAMRERAERAEATLEWFADTAERAVEAHENRGLGGQHVSYHGDFANCAPSVLQNLRWWAREMRSVLRKAGGA